jgi:hypothetical protein
MAKGQKRSGREPKKPKRNKPKVTPPTTVLSTMQPKPAAPANDRNK